MAVLKECIFRKFIGTLFRMVIDIANNTLGNPFEVEHKVFKIVGKDFSICNGGSDSGKNKIAKLKLIFKMCPSDYR
jgi:hypothetical protein